MFIHLLTRILIILIILNKFIIEALLYVPVAFCLLYVKFNIVLLLVGVLSVARSRCGCDESLSDALAVGIALLMNWFQIRLISRVNLFLLDFIHVNTKVTGFTFIH